MTTSYADLQGEVQGQMAEEMSPRVAKRFNIVSQCGKGAYGVVWKATDRRSRETVALKKCYGAFDNPTDAQRTYREVVYLLQMRGHDNIVDLRAVLKAENGRDLYLVFEHMETDLHAAIRAGILEDSHQRYVTYQAFRALAYMHSASLVHRDLKPANLLLDASCRMKLCDFGLARGAGEDGSTDLRGLEMTDYVATRWYRAPEILVGCQWYGKAVDLWALGCIVGEMINGKPLLTGGSTLNQIERILAVLGTPSEQDVASWQSPFAKSLLENAKVAAGPGGSQLSQSLPPNAPADAIDLINGLLRYDPTRRLPAYAINPSVECGLRHRYVDAFHMAAGQGVLLCESKAAVPIPDKPKKATAVYREALYAMAASKEPGTPDGSPTSSKGSFSPLMR